MNSPIISIIVPVYQAEKYLCRCIDSILAQTFTDWECILVDDGSTDKSGRICDEYATRDSRFRVFHKPNGGVSSARNLALDNARGEWVTFIDADDFISNNYFNAIEKSSVDIVFTESKKFFPITNEHTIIFSMPLCTIMDTCKYKNVLSEYIPNLAFRTPWGKFIKRSLIGDVRFELGQKLGEDTIFAYKIYKDAASIQFCDHSTYYWRAADSPHSVKYKLDVATGMLYLSRIYEAYQKLEILNPQTECFFLSYFFALLDREDLSKNSQKWYSSLIIKEMEHYALPRWSTRKKFEYLLWRVPRIAKMYHFSLGVLKKIIK